MAKSIFDNVSLEAMTDEDNTVVALPTNLEAQFRGIEVAIEHLGILAKMKQTVSNKECVSLDHSTVRLVNITTGSMLRSLNLDKEHKVVSTEDLTDSKTLAIESITDSIKAIWDAIIKTLEYIWGKIKSFFTGNKVKNSKAQYSAKQNLHNSKEIIKDIHLNPKSTEELPYVTNEVFLNPLDYLDKELSDKDLLSYLEDTKNAGKHLLGLINAVEIAYMNIEHNCRNFLSMPGKDFEELEAKNSECLVKGEISIFIESFNTINSSDSIYRDTLNDAVDDKKDIDSNSVRIIKPFINGSAVYFYKSITNNQDPYIVKTINSCSNNSGKVKFKVIDHKDLILFANKVSENTNVSVDIADHIAIKNRTIESIIDNITTDVYTLLSEASENSNHDQVDQCQKIIKDVVNGIGLYSAEIVKAYSRYQSTISYFEALNREFNGYYKMK